MLKTFNEQRGSVLLVIFGLVGILITSLIVLPPSMNAIKNSEQETVQKKLRYIREQILGYAITQAPNGVLPCPDVDDDGLEDPAVGGCTAWLGRVPYTTLSLPQGFGDERLPFWYAVNPANTLNHSALKNSSMLFQTRLDGEFQAAVILYSGEIFGAQSREPMNTSAVNYLEGANSDGDVFTYESVDYLEGNDRLLGISQATLWPMVERRTLLEIRTQLEAYQSGAACGQYPWAAPQGAAIFDSTSGLTDGVLPTGTALPEDWGSGCATGINLPAWVNTHWAGLFHYSMCDPSSTACIAINGQRNISASLVLLSSGVPLLTQSRPSALLGDYFESDNASLGSPYTAFPWNELTANFNDVVVF